MKAAICSFIVAIICSTVRSQTLAASVDLADSIPCEQRGGYLKLSAPPGTFAGFEFVEYDEKNATIGIEYSRFGIDGVIRPLLGQISLVVPARVRCAAIPLGIPMRFFLYDCPDPVALHVDEGEDVEVSQVLFAKGLLFVRTKLRYVGNISLMDTNPVDPLIEASWDGGSWKAFVPRTSSESDFVVDGLKKGLQHISIGTRELSGSSSEFTETDRFCFLNN